MSMLAARLKKHDVVAVYSQTAPLYDLWGELAESKARKKALALANISGSLVSAALGIYLFDRAMRNHVRY